MSISFTRRALGKALLATTAAVAFASAAFADNQRIALVVHGTLGDKSFFDSAHAGLLQAQADMPVELTVIEAGADRGRWEPALADAADQGFDIIVAGTWEMNAFMQSLAPEFPETKFILFDDTPDFAAADLPNVIGVTYRISTASYLAGYAAAKMSQTGKIGLILGAEGATLLEFAVGFEQGAKAANPNIEIARAVSGTFTDPAKGKELALAQFNQGVDVIFPVAGGTGVGALQAARDAGKLAIGVDSDQAMIFAEADPAQAEVIFTSVEKKVGASLYTLIQSTVEGTQDYGQNVILGLQEGAVGISKNAYFEAKVPAELQAELAELEAQIVSGEIVVETLMK